jgi:SPP1 family phage portal protein
MNIETLQKYLNQHSLHSHKRDIQKAYAIGNNTSILQPEAKASPDNRKPVPFARRAVAMIKGYMAKPGNITYLGDYYENTLKDIFDDNDEQLTTANELEDCLIYGECFELHWLEDGKKMFYPIPNSQSIPIWSTDLKRKLIGFIWYRIVDDVELATYYDDKIYQEWRKEKDWIAGVELPHGYGAVPINRGTIDRDGKNLFDHVIPLIDLYDKLISEDVANEAERFNAAIMLMAERIDTVTTDESGRTMVDRLKELRLLDGLGQEGDVKGKVAFVNRDIPTAFIEFGTGTVERLIYEMLMIVNPNDDNFATASGVAQLYKLLGMEFLSASIEAYFTRFLQNRIYLIAGIDKQIGQSDDGSREVEIKMTRNLPRNLADLADTISKLNEVLSQDS